jgi:membrane protein implicated in regulation of membrane protease activity
MPKEPSWWVWLATATLLAVGLAGHTAAFVAAIGLSGVQSFVFLARHRSWVPYPMQIRVAYTLLLVMARAFAAAVEPTRSPHARAAPADFPHTAAGGQSRA